MASRKTMRARQVELAGEIKRQADRLAVESSPARARESAEAVAGHLLELLDTVELLARVEA